MAEVSIAITSPPAPVRNVGKTALMLHWLGVLFLAAGVGVLRTLGVSTREGLIFFCFGATAFVVLTIWSIYQCCRGYLAGERSRYSFALALLVTFEFTFAFLIVFYFDITSHHHVLDNYQGVREVLFGLINNCIPALSAYLFIFLAVGVPLANVLSRRAESSQHAVRRRTWLVRIFLVSIVLILAPLLSVYSLVTLPADELRKSDSKLNVLIAHCSPHVVGEALESYCGNFNNLLCDDIQHGILWFGCVSKDRLLLRLDDNRPVVFRAAFHSFELRYPQDMQETLLNICKEPAPAGYKERTAAYWIGDHASPAQIREILDAGKLYNAQFRSGLLVYLTENRKSTNPYATDLLRLAADEELYTRMVGQMERDQINVAWNKLFAQKNWSDRAGLACVIPFFEISLTDQLKLYQQCLADPDLKMRRWAMASACKIRTEFNWSSAERDEGNAWLRVMIQYVDDPDIFIRRSAVHLMGTFTNTRVTLTPDESGLIFLPDMVPSPLVTGEDQERETVRAAANEHLQKP